MGTTFSFFRQALGREPPAPASAYPSLATPWRPM